jgi:hypothetical protein
VSRPLNDPVLAIPEAQASGDIAALYEDIRATLGVPVVNLIWRHLAATPGALEWAWASLRPAYQSGAIADQASTLRGSLVLPSQVSLDSSELASAGLSASDIESIEFVLRAYERSNAMNLVALAALLAGLNKVAPGENEVVNSKAGGAALTGVMPGLPPIDAMPDPLRALVEDLNDLGGQTVILPTMYRHLSHWPAFLALVYGLLAPLDADARLQRLISEVVIAGHVRGASVCGQLAQQATVIEGDVEALTRGALVQFMHGPLAKMTVIVGIVRQAMPQPA